MLTGAQTYFGRTTELVQKARPKLHIEAVVGNVVRWLFVIVGGLLCVVVVLSLMRGTPLIEMVSLLLVLLMSAVPVALPVMFTVSMAVGAAELAKRGVLVTRLSAAEDAATMDVLCVDKTGTITMNQLAVTGVIPLAHRRRPMCCLPVRAPASQGCATTTNTAQSPAKPSSAAWPAPSPRPAPQSPSRSTGPALPELPAPSPCSSSR